MDPGGPDGLAITGTEDGWVAGYIRNVQPADCRRRSEMTPHLHRRAQEVFASAVTRPVESRAAYLDGACGHPLHFELGTTRMSFLRRMHSAFGMGTLAEVSLSGGAPRQLLEGVSGADWSPDGRASRDP